MDKDKELLSIKEENRKLKENLKKITEESVQHFSRIKKLEEEIERLKEENQKLRLELFGIKPSKKKEEKSSDDFPNHEHRKRGPPIGHKGASRKKPDRVDRTVVLKLKACPHCDGKIKELKQTRERSMEDIIPLTLFVTKYIIKQGYCKNCDTIVYPEIPEIIGNCHFGLHFLLYITYLRYVMNLPDNKIATLLNDIYDAKVSEGTIVDYLKRAAQIFGDDYERIKRQMGELNCHYDDTGQRVDGENRWLWVHGGLQQIFKDAKETEKQLGSEEDRCREFEAFVDKLESFANRKWASQDMKRLAKQRYFDECDWHDEAPREKLSRLWKRTCNGCFGLIKMIRYKHF